MKLSIAAKKKREAYLFILPGFLYLLIVCGYPLLYNIVLSFKNMNVKNMATGTSVFVGLENYQTLFSDPTFQMVFKNTIIFTLACLAIQFTIGFLFAMFFFKKVYSGRTCTWSDPGRLYDAYVCYRSFRKEPFFT